MLQEALEQVIEREKTMESTVSPLGTCKAGEYSPLTVHGLHCTEEKGAVTATLPSSQRETDEEVSE
jgi:hypothetical protein